MGKLIVGQDTKDNDNKRTAWHTMRLLRDVAAGARVTVSSLFLPALYATLASVAEGLTFALLIPITEHVVEGKDLATHAALQWIPGSIVSHPHGVLVTLVLATFVAATAKVVFTYGSTFTTAKHVRIFSSKLRIAVYERLLRAGKLFYDQRSSGQLQQLLTTYVSLIANSLSSIQSLLYSGCTLLVYIALMCSLSLPLTALVFFVFPLLHYSLSWLIERIRKTSLVYADSYNALSARISNALSSIPLVKAYTNEREEIEKFRQASDQVAGYEISIERKGLLVGPLQELILLCFLFIFMGLAALVMRGTTDHTVSNGLVYLIILKRAATLFGVLNTVQSCLAGIAGPTREVLDIFKDETSHSVPDGNKPFSGLTSIIEVRELSFTYPQGVAALNKASFTIPRGTMTAIVGPTGSGKSTIMNLLMRFYDPSPRTILVDGVDMRDFSLESWRASIALVSQDTYLFHGSLRENLVYGLHRTVDDREIADALAKARLVEFVNALPAGLDSVIGDRGVKLSGGERQRVAIARAILKKAEIMLLDEATSALDSTTERLIQSALDDLLAQRTSIVVAHRLSTIRKADRIVVLTNGAVTEHGAFSDLLSRGGAFRKLWHDQYSSHQQRPTDG